MRHVAVSGKAVKSNCVFQGHAGEWERPMDGMRKAWYDFLDV